MIDTKLRPWSELTPSEQGWRLAIFAGAFLISANLLYMLVPSIVLALVYGAICGVVVVWQAPTGRTEPEYFSEEELDGIAEEQPDREHEAA